MVRCMILGPVMDAVAFRRLHAGLIVEMWLIAGFRRSAPRARSVSCIGILCARSPTDRAIVRQALLRHFTELSVDPILFRRKVQRRRVHAVPIGACGAV